jgi:gluconolactonase
MTTGSAIPASSTFLSRWDSGAAPVRYPDPAIQVLDPRFARLVLGNAAVERIATGFRFTEGPVWFGDGRYLLFSDIPSDRILRWDDTTGQTSVFREPSHYANGNTRDRQGRLLTCEHDTQHLTRTEHDGRIAILAHAYEGKKLTGPNDVAVKSDGSIWFSDNGAGTRGNYLGHTMPQLHPFRVYRIAPGTGLMIAIDDMQRPNGLAFSPDETRLYVVDTPNTGPKRTFVYDIVDDGTRATNGRVFFDAMPGFADGIRVDTEGNVWCGFAGSPDQDGVAVFAPDGTLIGRILLPERCANLCFGGRKRNRLFMAASQSLYALYVEAQGATIC